MRSQINRIFMFIVAIFALGIFIFFTNPGSLPLPVLFLPFILVYLSIYIAFSTFADLFLVNLKPEKRRWAVGALSVIPVALLLVMSAGQTDPEDVLLFLLLTVLVVFYLSRTNF